jgi:cytochrome P450
VRKGETLALSHVAWSLDDATWGEPTKYCAARFEYRSPVSYDRRGDCDDVKFSVFSQGAHRCPGETLALVIVETVLALYHSRNVQVDQKAWELHSEAIPPVCFQRATLAQRAGPVKCKLLAPRVRA